jgi:hypothetical protein
VQIATRAVDVDEPPRAEVKKRGKEIVVELPQVEELRTKKSSRELAAAIMGVFEIALQETTTEAKRDKFRELLLSVLSKW